ncbi:hypothetical protein OsJ_32533 [Oryza sativa Japonica Group]|uniref:Uncharacterized protein n=1 Tax=Oryza sativa subsp. japonica TaxID=39947 RepID=A3C7I0_ORYSJ|nr:hypothetical protein OsJ_32533 [Oryza sativa Japonica Group]
MQPVLQRSTATPYSVASRRSSGGRYQSVMMRLERLRPGGVKKVARPKSAILSTPVAVDEQVGALDVSMQHAPFMAAAELDEDMRHEALDLRLHEVQPRCGGEVLLMILALICTLHTVPVDGAGRDRSRRSLDPNYRPSVPPGRPYTPTPPGCNAVYGCRNSPPSSP